MIRDFKSQCMVAGQVLIYSWIHLLLCCGCLMPDFLCDFGVLFWSIEALFEHLGAHNPPKVGPGSPRCPPGWILGGPPAKAVVILGYFFTNFWDVGVCFCVFFQGLIF